MSLAAGPVWRTRRLSASRAGPAPGICAAVSPTVPPVAAPMAPGVAGSGAGALLPGLPAPSVSEKPKARSAAPGGTSWEAFAPAQASPDLFETVFRLFSVPYAANWMIFPRTGPVAPAPVSRAEKIWAAFRRHVGSPACCGDPGDPDGRTGQVVDPDGPDEGTARSGRSDSPTCRRFRHGGRNGARRWGFRETAGRAFRPPSAGTAPNGGAGSPRVAAPPR